MWWREAHSPRHAAAGATRARLVLALAALGLGLALYLTARPPGHAALVPAFFPTHFPALVATHFPALVAAPVFHGALAGALPSFLHVFAFIVLTAVLAAPGRVAAACAGWLALEALLEVAQAAPVARGLAAALPAAWGPVTAYFRHGTFDPLDLAAAAAGTLAAYAVLTLPRTKGPGHASPTLPA